MYKNITTNLMVASVDASVKFYQEVLGLEVVASVPAKDQTLQFAILAKEAMTLMLQEKGNLSEEYPILAAEKIQPSITLYITVENFEEFYTTIKSNYPIYTEPHATFYGAKEFAITDPDGYVLTFTEYKEG
ncbi:VOC family protein [Enterococcus raffinosus]|uniref:VOC family protein n=1 Tax=Enterococcus raffinosus TaxID=71452 RepID=UPI001C10B881|nr:VOC family protein [Enterococcus raffinosus]MBU5359468.1 VOC family protein [Enterococcus raffinosus]